MSRNVFILGLDESNAEVLQALPMTKDVTFHGVLTPQELQEGEVSVPDLLDKARAQLDAFQGSIDAIVTYWDFPATMMVPVLCERHGLPSASLDAVVRSEHKYWSRLDQRKVITEYPGFGLLDLEDPQADLPDGVTYPAWVKPVESASSEGSYRVGDVEQLREVLPTAREEVTRLGRPFEAVLAMLDLPPDIAEAGGMAYLAEEAVGGQQMTVEGYVHDGVVTVYGLVDSVQYPDKPSFLRYQYPSQAPPYVQDHIIDVSRKVITVAGLDSTAFNIEFFWDEAADQLWVLEVNVRHSQSHALLFKMVDGVANHLVMVNIGLGREPGMLHRQGTYALASKWFYRLFTDGVVRRIPTAQEVAAIEERIPGTRIEVVVPEGRRLSEGYGEDSYSYDLAHIYIGGTDEADVVRKYEQCVEALPLQIDAAPEGT